LIKENVEMRTNNPSGCLAGARAFFSRIMLLMFWISRPVAWNATFGGIILPCLGFLFLPITTMMYAWLVQGVGGIQGLDWLWLILAVFLDLSGIAAAGAANRDRIPAGVPGSTQPPAGTPPQQPPAATS
jgi:hypothetical protein